MLESDIITINITIYNCRRSVELSHLYDLRDDSSLKIELMEARESNESSDPEESAVLGRLLRRRFTDSRVTESRVTDSD